MEDLIEIPDPDESKKADDLAARLREVLGNVATVSRPVVKGEIRLVGLDDSVSVEEVKTVIAREGSCDEEEVKPGPIRRMYNGLGSVWLQCPLAAAMKVIDKGKVRIGWTMTRADLLKARRVQCFRCWKFGHVRFACKEAVNRTGRCFRCGESGHRSSECSAAPRCVICAEANLPSGVDTMQRSSRSNWSSCSSPLLVRTREVGNVSASDRRTEITSTDYD